MDLQKISIKDYCKKVLKERKKTPEQYKCIIDWDDTAFILMRNYEDTIDFLSKATIEEIAWAVEVLEDISYELPKDKAQTIINIFKKKLEEFPNVEDYSEVQYSLELQIAENILNKK